MENKYAILTLATTQNYLRGARLLYNSYIKNNNTAPFYIMIFPETDTRGYEDLPLIKVNELKAIKRGNDKKYDNLRDSFGKLNAWLFIQYDYIFYIDADTLIADNLDKYLYLSSYLLEKNNANAMFPEHSNSSTNTDEAFQGSWFFLKPNKAVYFNALDYISNSITDEEIYYKLNANNQIKAICYNKFEHYSPEQANNVQWNIRYAVRHMHFPDEEIKYWNLPNWESLLNICLNQDYNLYFNLVKDKDNKDNNNNGEV